MNDTRNSGSFESVPRSKKPGRRWIFTRYARTGVRVTLILSLSVFAIYLAGSIPEPGFSDRALFFLLQTLRYISLVLSAFSLFAMGSSVHRLVCQPGWRNALALCFYFVTGMFGAGLVMLNSLIIAAAGGNG